MFIGVRGGGRGEVDCLRGWRDAVVGREEESGDDTGEGV